MTVVETIGEGAGRRERFEVSLATSSAGPRALASRHHRHH